MLPVGTKLVALEPEAALDETGALAAGLSVGDAHPWNEIEIVAHEQGANPVEAIVRPITWSNISTNRRVSFEVLLDLYDVAELGQNKGTWELAGPIPNWGPVA